MFVYSRDYGLNIFQRKGFFEINHLKKIAISKGVNYLFNGHDDYLLIGSKEGLYNYGNETLTEVLPKIDVLHIFRDSKNRYWVSTIGDGLIVLDDKFKVISRFFKNEKVNVCYNVVQFKEKEFYVATSLGLYALRNQMILLKLKKSK
ncbi:MAG: hypothetical protein HC854_02880 [Flavobacterium sp.]|nr:hypothetical protein [Flavobacterium sp.]